MLTLSRRVSQTGNADCLTLVSGGEFDDQQCQTQMPVLCETEFTLCGNGVFDPDIGEEGVDCGGTCPACAPLFTSAFGSSGTTVNANTVTFTATFGTPVSGVTVSDFNLQSGNLTVAQSVAPADGGAPSKAWVLTVTISPPLSTTALTVSLPAASGAITPANKQEASNNGFNLLFEPVAVAIASGQSQPVVTPRLLFTFTFSEPVSGVAASDFVVDAQGMGVTQVLQPTTVPSSEYVLIVDVTSGFKAAAVSVTLADAAVSPQNQAAGPVSILYDPPVPAAWIQGGNQDSGTAATTFTGTMNVVVDFGTPVAGVSSDNFRVDTDGLNVTFTMAADGAEPTPSWLVTATANPGTSLGAAWLFLDNGVGISPPPATVDTALFNMTFAEDTSGQISGQEANNGADGPPASAERSTDFKWWGIVLISGTVVLGGVGTALYVMNKAKKVDHLEPLGDPKAMHANPNNAVQPATGAGPAANATRSPARVTPV